MRRGGIRAAWALASLNKVMVIFIGLAFLMPVAFVYSEGLPSGESPLSTPIMADSFYRQNDMIMLAVTEYDVRAGPNGLPGELIIDQYDGRIPGYYLVKFNDAVDHAWLAELEAMGAGVGAYVPYNTYMVKMDAATSAKVTGMPHVMDVSVYQPWFKISPGMLDGVELQSGMLCAGTIDFISRTNLFDQASVLGQHDSRIPVTITMQEGENPYNMAALIGKAGGKVLAITDSSVRAEVPRKGIQALAFVNEVQYIQPYQSPSPMLADTAWTEQSKVADSTPVWDHGITGTGVVIGTADTGVNTDHEHFRHAGYTPSNWIGPSPTHRKITGYYLVGDNRVDYDGHGTGVAGCAAGDGGYVGSVNPNRYGMAPGAKLSICDVGKSDDGSGTNDYALGGIPADMKVLYAITDGDGASIHVNAWGLRVAYGGVRTYAEGTYTEDCLNTDQYMWQNKDYLVVFPVGGDRAEPPYGGPAYTTTVCPPATAKNIVSVASHGAGTSWNQIASWSSWGATNDGRLKPDIATTGMDLYVPSSDYNRDGALDTTYVSMQGTSLSAGIAAGDTALISQYFRDGWYPVTASSPVAANGFVPSNALLKATLINGAKDSTSGTYSNVHPYVLNGHSMIYPNTDQGWGMVDTGDSLYFYGDAREVWVDDNQNGLLTGQFREYKLGVQAGQELEITLAWTDYQGSVATWGGLVNDLDLTVIGPTGTVYYGNNFGTTSREADSSNPAGYDHTNPVEAVLVKTPAPGEWTVRITAPNIPVGPQPYALVAAGNFDEGWGWVSLDKNVYKPGDTVMLEVQDANVAAGSLSVQLTSSTGDIETVMLTEVAANSRRFVGSIAANGLTPISGNGIISIQNNGWLSAKYVDNVPAHISYANATTDMTSPMITDVHVTDISNTAAIVHWTTDVPATSQVFYGTTGALGSSTAVDLDLVLQHSAVLTNLSSFTNYHFDVQSVSVGGVTTRDSNGGDHYQFTTIDNPDVLIVLESGDSESSELRLADWQLSFDHFGWSYIVWEVVKYGYPSMAALNSAKAMLWDTGELYPQLGAIERVLIQNWLNQAGTQRWFVTGQDIGWDMCDIIGTDYSPTWFNTYLHASYVADDASGGNGNEGTRFQIIATTHPISTGLGNMDLEQDIYGAGRFWPDEIINDRGGDNPPPWQYTRYIGGGNAAAIAYQGSDYRLVYEAFAHAMIQDDDTFGTPGNVFGTDLNLKRATVTDRSLIWLLGEDHPDVEINYPDGGETLSGSVNILWNVSNAVTQEIHVSRDGGQSFIVEASGLAGDLTAYSWNTARTDAGQPVYPNGANYKVKVVAQGASLVGFDVSEDVFTVNNGAAGDNTGPVIIAGSIKADPLPGGQGNFITFEAFADDRAKGNSNIAAAEFFIDSTGTSGTGYPMDASDGSFDLQVEEVTGTWRAYIAQGTHKVYVHARDAAGNWGGYEEFTFQINEGGPTVFVTSPNTAENIVSGTIAITWTAEDYTDPAGSLDCKIEYSANGGTSWNVLEDGVNNNDGIYNWDTTLVPDGVNYLVRVSATDSFPLTMTDVCDYVFSVDNTMNDRWYLQVEAAGSNHALNMAPIDSGPNMLSSAMIGAPGQYIIGTWQTDPLSATGFNGIWSFNLYGAASDNIGIGNLYAKVYRSGGPTLLDTTVKDDENVFSHAVPHLFTWIDSLACSFPSGESLIVEIWVDVSVVSTSQILTTAQTTQASGPHDVWFTIVDDSSQAELTMPNSVVEFTDQQYIDAATSDDIRAGPSAAPPIGDETFVKCRFSTDVKPATVSDITLTFEGSFSATGTGTMYAWNAATAVWDIVGATTSFAAGVEQTMTRTITANWANYVSGGAILWGVYNSVRGTCSVDFLQVQLTFDPVATVSIHFDYPGAQSFIEPSDVPPLQYAINLAGKPANSWVFVSFPIGVSGPITSILNDATLGDGGTTWSIARWYDSQDPADPWKVYRPGGQFNDMPDIDNSKGVWLWLTANGGDQALTVGSVGSVPASSEIILKAGWNMVGYPSMTPTSTLPLAVDMVNDGTGDYPPGSITLSHGHGYWLRATADCIWMLTSP